MASVTQLGYLGLGVSDMAAWEEFATDVLGMQINGKTERDSMFLRTDLYHHRFEVYATGEDDILYTGWEVKDAAALAEVVERVRSFGIEVEDCTKEDTDERMVLGLARFKDPNGLQTELYYGPYLDQLPFNSPRGLSGFRTGEIGGLGLGHIVLHVPDVMDTLGFYTDALGVKVSDFIEMGRGEHKVKMAFTHANGRHHSLAFAPHFGPPQEGVARRRLNHFMIEVNSLDEVGITLGMFQQRGMPAGSIGRHTNDWMVSFYAPTPSGFQVEYGTGGRLVDDTNWEVQHYKAASIWGHSFAQPAPRPQGIATPTGTA